VFGVDAASVDLAAVEDLIDGDLHFIVPPR
jgi:hypothetical protein